MERFWRRIIEAHSLKIHLDLPPTMGWKTVPHNHVATTTVALYQQQQTDLDLFWTRGRTFLDRPTGPPEREGRGEIGVNVHIRGCPFSRKLLLLFWLYAVCI